MLKRLWICLSVIAVCVGLSLNVNIIVFGQDNSYKTDIERLSVYDSVGGNYNEIHDYGSISSDSNLYASVYINSRLTNNTKCTALIAGYDSSGRLLGLTADRNFTVLAGIRADVNAVSGDNIAFVKLDGDMSGVEYFKVCLWMNFTKMIPLTESFTSKRSSAYGIVTAVSGFSADGNTPANDEVFIDGIGYKVLTGDSSKYKSLVGSRVSYNIENGVVRSLTSANYSDNTATTGITQSMVDTNKDNDCIFVLNGSIVPSTYGVIDGAKSIRLIDNDNNGKADFIFLEIKNFISPDKNYIISTADDFTSNMGNWTTSSDIFQYAGVKYTNYVNPYMKGVSNSNIPAKRAVYIPHDGEYRILAHTANCNYADEQRRFSVSIDGSKVILGNHGQKGWHWSGGDKTVRLFAGEYTIEVYNDVGSYPRFEMLIITDDNEFEPYDTEADMTALKKHNTNSLYSGNINAPQRPDTECAVRINNSYITSEVSSCDGYPVMSYTDLCRRFGLGYEVGSDGDTVKIMSGSKYITYTVNSANAYLYNGEDLNLIKLSARCYLASNGKIMLPVDSVLAFVSCKYKWYEEEKTLAILTEAGIAEEDNNNILLTTTSFSSAGSWTVQNYADQSSCFEDVFLLGTVDNGQPAQTTISVDTAGTYYVWVHTWNNGDGNAANRSVNVGVNGKKYTQSHYHTGSGYQWESAPESVTLNKGDNSIQLYANWRYTRCDGIIITPNKDFVPSNDYATLLAQCKHIQDNNYLNGVFPEYANVEGTVLSENYIENNNVRIAFYKSQNNGRTVVQNEIYKYNGSKWIKTKDKSEGLGWLIIRADSANNLNRNSDLAGFSTQFTYDGGSGIYAGTNMFKMGDSDWVIPSSMTKKSDNSISITGSGKYGTVTAVWTLSDGDENPVVNVDATFSKDGAYSVGIYEGGSFTDDEYEFALTPYRVYGKKIDAAPGAVITQHYAFTPMATITLPAENRYNSGCEITKGVVVEPSWIPRSFVYAGESKFGLGLRNLFGDIQPVVFSPLMESFNANDTYSFRYVVVNELKDWYDSYLYVAQDLFDITDYREPYYCSLNTAIFNATRLMMDDKYSGWDTDDNAHYNVEFKDLTVSSTNPMQAMQSYLLSDNDDILRRRAIPTLASMLSKKSTHFTNDKIDVDNVYLSASKTPVTIGSPNLSFGLNVYGGMYEQMQGRTPSLLEIGENDIVPTTFSQNLSAYKYTGEEQYLTKAKELADQYLAKAVYATQDTPTAWASFVYEDHYPNLSQLMELYECCGDQKYLDAAEYVGKLISIVPWVPGIDNGKGDEIITVNDKNTLRAHSRDNIQWCWRGSDFWRIGANINAATNTADYSVVDRYKENVPAWVASQVGLGLEQSSTYFSVSNIVMSMWAGDMVKLSYYTGNDYFETVARNAIIGRFGNYTGYYYMQYMTYQMQENYPYEGVDNTGIYVGHIPVFLSMLEDFIINTTYKWSDGNIEFPNIRERGYAYFNSNQYGHAPGKFFDENDMWLWLDEGMLTVKNKGIDYIAAKKDGVLGFALINETNKAITDNFVLGDKIPGGSNYSGIAEVYDKTGKIGTVQVYNGEFVLTIPAKTLKAVKLKISGISTPSYAKDRKVDYLTNTESTVAEHENGKAYILQASPDSYFAYVYIADKPNSVSSAVMRYSVGNDTYEMTDNTYPFEFIVEVDNPDKSFSYDIDVISVSGSKYTISGNTLKAIQ